MSFFFKDRVQATLEVFDFGREDDRAHMKAYVRVPFLTYLYAQAGYDDFITKQDTPTRQRSAFAGLGMRFTDEDIKTVLLLGMP